MKRLLALVCLAALMAGMARAGDAAWFRPYDKAAGYCYAAFGRYPHEADGAERPILWRALEYRDGAVYLMSEYLIEVSRLHSVAFGYPGWDQADLNAWLNGAFIEKAFSREEAAALREMPDLGRVSLPSADDIKNPAFGFDSDQARRAVGTPWADSQGLFFYRHKGHSPYWTRTPSAKDFAHRTTKLEGNIGYLGVTADDLGVRPVIWLAPDAVQVTGGSGSQQDPYALAGLGTVSEAPAPSPGALPATPVPETAPAATALPAAAAQTPPPPVRETAEPVPAAPASPAPAAAVPAAPSASGWAQTGSLRTGEFPALTPEGFLPEGEKPYVKCTPCQGQFEFLGLPSAGYYDII